MRTVVFVAVLALFAVAASAASADSKVVILSPDNFKSVISSNTQTLVEFFAPWCGHCKALAPEYDKAAAEIDGKNAGALASVDCTVHRDLCEQYEVQGFPTVKLIRQDGTASDYEGARKASAIASFMIKQAAPPVTELADAAAVDAFVNSEEIRVVAFLSDAHADQKAAFTKVANALRNDYSFAATTDAAAASARGVTAPAVVLFRKFDENVVTYNGDVSDNAALTTWIKAQSFPIIGEIGPENYAKYLERGFNFVWIFVDFANDAQKQLLETITPVAADFRSQLSFVKLDGLRWAEHAKSFGLSGNTPGIVIEDRKARRNYVLPEDAQVTAEKFREWVSGVQAGTIPATVKSEPIPEKNDGPVKVIVGHTFNEIVMDDSKDVFVEFYAPWCGHCKSLTPKYEELGKLFQADSSVVVAKVDATANDTPAEVQGFPTLILYPAGDKSNPVNYEGERTAKAMAAFINANGKANGRPTGASASADSEDDHDHDHEGHDHGAHDDEL